MKKIIYGISNYKTAIENDYLYIDKTKYIEVLENLNERYLIFLRPRRFGKSLFLSTLQYYYDENSAHEFDKLFVNTYIGENTTPLKSSFRILFLEFSGINIDGGIDKVYESFRDNIYMALQNYFMNYGYERYIPKLEEIKTPLGLIKFFFGVVKNDKIYLLIDEYDQFANAILAYSMQDFLKIIGKGGFVRSFYEVIKTATFSGVVQKMFITGVTPITLDSLSSGFNIVSNISNSEKFNAMAGFRQEEVNYSLEQSILKKCPNIDKKVIKEKMQKWYNGYLFNTKAQDRIYNSTMVNYFLSQYDYKRCQFPQKMLDSNVASDYKAIMKLFNIGDSNRNYKLLEELIEKGSIIGEIKDRYDLNQDFTRDDFITLIYSMGFITIKDTIVEELYRFEIPNYVIKILYFNYFAVEIARRNDFNITKSIGEILVQLLLGDIEPFKNQLEEVVKILSNRDYIKFETNFQVITLSLLSFANYYFIESQPEKNSKYPDILLIGRDPKVPNNYLFELKWAKKKDNYEHMKKDGIKQVKGYLELDKIKSISKLRAFLIMGSKSGVEFIEV